MPLPITHYRSVAPWQAHRDFNQERYRLDCKGWFIRRNVIGAGLLAELRMQEEAGRGDAPGGAAEYVIPMVLDVVRAVVDESPTLNIALFRRLAQGSPEGTMAELHGGRGGGVHSLWRHGFKDGIPSVGCLSVIVELDDIGTEEGTHIIPGSHRAEQDLPWRRWQDVPRDFWESYTCKAGSILIWNEHVAHWGPPAPRHDRRSLLLKFTQNQTSIRTQPWPQSAVDATDCSQTVKMMRDGYGRTPVRSPSA